MQARGIIFLSSFYLRTDWLKNAEDRKKMLQSPGKPGGLPDRVNVCLCLWLFMSVRRIALVSWQATAPSLPKAGRPLCGFSLFFGPKIWAAWLILESCWISFLSGLAFCAATADFLPQTYRWMVGFGQPTQAFAQLKQSRPSDSAFVSHMKTSLWHEADSNCTTGTTSVQLMLAFMLTTVKVASLPSILFAEWTG